MKTALLIQNNSSQLLLFFAGWGMDAAPFKRIRSESMDVMIVYDYTDLQWDAACLDHYQAIHLVAWSMGVWVAEQLLSEYSFASATAINGTSCPIDREYGIPPAIFEGTLNTLSAETSLRFNKRMCGSVHIFNSFKQISIERSVESLRTELAALYNHFVHAQTNKQAPSFWSKAYISMQDRIFPTENLLRFWSNHLTEASIEQLEAPHFPFYLWDNWDILVSPLSVEKRRIASRFAAAQLTYDVQATAQQHIQQHLLSLLRATVPSTHIKKTAEIGCGTGGFTHLLKQTFTPEIHILNDLYPLTEKLNKQYYAEFEAGTMRYIQGDAEQLHFGKELDLIVSASAIQWFLHPYAFIQRMAAMLSDKGVLLLSTFGPKNLQEIKALTGMGLTYPSLETVQTWAAPAFDMQHIEEEELTLFFDHPFEVLQHLKQTGVTATQPATNWTRGRLAQFSAQYIKEFTIDEKVKLTYHPIYVVLTKKKKSK